MSKRKRWTPRMRQILYYTAVVLLVAASIYQLYSISEQLSDTVVSPAEAVEEKVSASLLMPYEMYMTAGDDQGYARIQDTSGYYLELSEQSLEVLGAVADRIEELYYIEEAELPESEAVLVLKYACTLEYMALTELLSFDVTEENVCDEIWIQPSVSRQDTMVIYLISWEQGSYMRIQSSIGWGETVNQEFCAAFYEVSDAVAKEYWAGWRSFPDIYRGGNYYMQVESDLVLYAASLEPAYVSEDSYASKEAAEYVMHFFPHPDTAKVISDSDGAVWYADERRTVRLEADGFLQYVETPERTEEAAMLLSEAYQMAVDFLEEDLREDITRLMEVYLCEYEIENGEYTFYWNYKLDNVPMIMDPERQEEWDLPYPIKITVEDGIVRYYHRYIVNKEMLADQMFKVQLSYIDALDAFRSQENSGLIEKMELCYEEQEDMLVLCWKILVDGEWYTIPMEGGAA